MDEKIEAGQSPIHPDNRMDLSRVSACFEAHNRYFLSPSGLRVQQTQVSVHVFCQWYEVWNRNRM
jgi:hypothetical protein